MTESTPCIRDLSVQEILDMELENLACIFLIDFSQRGNGSMNSFIYHCIKNRNNINEPLCEACQWLYNRGYIMENLVKPGDFFITRAGQKFLDSNKL